MPNCWIVLIRPWIVVLWFTLAVHTGVGDDLSLAGSSATGSSPTGSIPIDIGSRKQLFVDDYLIEASEGVEFLMNRPRMDGQVLLTNDHSWESRPRMYLNAYGSVLKENGIVRLWYDLWERDEEMNGMHGREGYAESNDGLQFTKPIQNQYEVYGSKENNIVLPGSIGGTAVWTDSHAPPAHRYKTQAKVYPSGKFIMHSSPDGLHWKQFAQIDSVPDDVDTQSIVFWDPHIDRYVLYTRFWKSHRHQTAEKPADYRAVRRMESDDLIHWVNQVIVLEPNQDDIDRHNTSTTPPGKPPLDYYGACVFPYGDEQLYIMLAEAYWHWIPRRFRGRDLGPEGGPATIDVRLAVSRDGIHFQRMGNWAPFMALGPEGRFDSRSVWVLPNPVRMGDELWIYYCGTNRDHNDVIDPVSRGTFPLDPNNVVLDDLVIDPEYGGKVLSGIGRAVLRLDGFVSADTDHRGGQLTTPLLTFNGKRLELNVDTSGGGLVEVELLDQQGHPIPGFTREDVLPVNGNSVRMPVRWKGANSDVSQLAGKPIKVRFLMRECKLYAFQFVD